MVKDYPLADLQDVTIDPALPSEDRLLSFVQQIKNPYCFRCGKFTIHAEFSGEVSLEDRVKQILL